MFVRNLLQAGDHVTIVPSGVKLSIQYSEHGVLEKVYVGYADNQVLHPELLDPVLKTPSIPRRIQITKGTSFVYGVLYTKEVFSAEGQLDKEVEASYLTEYLKDPSKFIFYAGYIQSYAVGINLPMQISRWLKTAGFNTLPGYLVPPGVKEETFASLLKLDTFPFKYPRIQSYIVYRKGKYSFPATDVKQIVVKKMTKYINYEGYILEDIQGQEKVVVSVNYSDVVSFNIHVGSVLLVNDENKILDCYNGPKVKEKDQPAKITCEYCGRVIVVPQTGRVCCSDEHCTSVIYPHVRHMLGTLGFEVISKEKLEEYGRAVNHVVSLPDILDLEQYEGKSVKVELPTLLYAVVPEKIVPTLSIWIQFCSSCNNSVESVIYYLQNPDKILSDLHLNSPAIANLIRWLKDMQNVTDVVEMINHEKIQVVASGKKFEGDPIFRGKSIYITGLFKHGSLEDIRSIFASYAATVYETFNTDVDCVVVGDLHEQISGKSINRAKQMHIPIFEEHDFFDKYDIDTDLRRNGIQ